MKEFWTEFKEAMTVPPRFVKNTLREAWLMSKDQFWINYECSYWKWRAKGATFRERIIPLFR